MSRIYHLRPILSLFITGMLICFVLSDADAASASASANSRSLAGNSTAANESVSNSTSLIGNELAANTTSSIDDPDATLRVGIRIVPPFVIKAPDGSYQGLTIALWSHIASELDLDYVYVERDIQGLINGVARTDDQGQTDLFAAASALTITAEREELLDFTHPFYVTGLGIAVAHKPAGLRQAFFALFSTDFLWVVGLLVLLLLFWGMLVWWVERRANPDQFGGTAGEGIGNGFWWAAVTMTTVGYGDKAPVTVPGRLIGFIWMFAGIILISFFTASIASSLTVSQLDSRVVGPQDLPHVRVGALNQSATLDYLNDHRIRYQGYETIPDGLQAVADDDIDAFVHDESIIRFYTSESFQGEVRVLPQTFVEQYYGIALPLNSPARNDINRVILEYISGDEWNTLLHRYLGD